MKTASRRSRKRGIACLAVLMALTCGILGYSLFLSFKDTSHGEESLPVHTGSEVESRPFADEPSYELADPIVYDDLDPDKPIAALTINDSVTDLTDAFVEVLTENNCEATFFVVGYLAQSNPEITRNLAENGMEIGNHTYSHQQLVGLSGGKVDEQLKKEDELLLELVGSAPSLMRPPYGRVDSDVLFRAGKPVVLWDIDTRDADAESAQEIVDRILQARDGNIIVIHDGIEITLEALALALPLLRENGIQITSVSKMFAAKGITMLPGEKYHTLPNIK